METTPPLRPNPPPTAPSSVASQISLMAGNNNNNSNGNGNNNIIINNNNNNSPCAFPSSTSSSSHQNEGGALRRCAGCDVDILDRYLLQAVDRFWHTSCLKCSLCQVQLGDVGTTCFTRAGMILCRADYIRLFGSTGSCAACGESIPPSELVLKVSGNVVYHLNCFTCGNCHNRLVAGDRYRIVNGSIICEHDYPKFIRATAVPPTQRTRHKVC